MATLPSSLNRSVVVMAPSLPQRPSPQPSTLDSDSQLS